MAKETTKVRNIKNLLAFIAETRQLPPRIQSLNDGTNFNESIFQNRKKKKKEQFSQKLPLWNL